MPRVEFTPHLRRFVDCPPATVEADTVRGALEAVFAGNPRLRGYILDEAGALRTHVAVFVDGRPLRDREAQSDPVGPSGEVYVLQALSGG
jgi:hypothetical protein